MRIVVFLILFYATGSIAQDITGIWKGKLYQEPQREYYFEIHVETIDFNGKLSGVTYVKEYSTGNHGTISFEGSFKNKVFMFKEIEILKEIKDKDGGYYASNTWFWCLKNGSLSFFEQDDTYILQGPWNGAGTCSGGTLKVSKEKPKDDVDPCADITSAKMMLGAWRGKFHQHGCNVYETFPMVVLIDAYDGMKFSGQFIWTDMKYAKDSRSTLEGEIKNGQVYFYENELISGGGIVLNGTYKSDLISCDELEGYWFLEKLQDDCQDPQTLKNGGDYDLEHYIIPTIYFDHTSADLSDQSKKDLDEFVQFLKDFPSMKFEMLGHTDNTGSNAFNITLSKERARVVVDYLVSKGISARRFTYTFHAQTKPAQKNDSEDNRQLNRRTEIKLLPGKN